MNKTHAKLYFESFEDKQSFVEDFFTLSHEKTCFLELEYSSTKLEIQVHLTGIPSKELLKQLEKIYGKELNFFNS
jgi:hypothetical protein